MIALGSSGLLENGYGQIGISFTVLRKVESRRSIIGPIPSSFLNGCNT